MNLNAEYLIRLPMEDSITNFLNGFWRWVQILADDDYQRGLECLYWARETSWTSETLKERVTTFFGGDNPWSVVIPNERLINVINDATEFEPRNQEEWAWFMSQIPLTTEPEDPNSDEIPLMGLAVSFYVREYDGSYVLEHEIFHA